MSRVSFKFSRFQPSLNCQFNCDIEDWLFRNLQCTSMGNIAVDYWRFRYKVDKPTLFIIYHFLISLIWRKNFFMHFRQVKNSPLFLCSCISIEWEIVKCWVVQFLVPNDDYIDVSKMWFNGSWIIYLLHVHVMQSETTYVVTLNSRHYNHSLWWT